MSEVGPASNSAPLHADEFAALMRPLGAFPNGASFAVAVSGGPDSMALSFCMKRWCAAQGHHLRAFIVDHALRAESAAEAATTKERLGALDIPADILKWEHGVVTSRLHITARRARYELITKACKNAGISHLLLAHQREDQAETIVMRLAKGSGIDGLAGIAVASMKDGVHVLRPLLAISKERLIATCHDAKISFVTDPSNASEKFARGRLRRMLPLLAEEGLTVERLVELGDRARTARDALDYYTHELLRTAAEQNIYGVVSISIPALMSAPRAIIERAITICLQTVHAGDYAPEHLSLTRLVDDILSGEPMAARTLHGCLISQRGERVTIMREYAMITEFPTLNPGETLLWDGRWHVALAPSAGADNAPLTVRPLGNPPHENVDQLSPQLRHDLPQGRARATLPSLWLGKNLVAIPAFNDGKTGFSATAKLRNESQIIPFLK